MARTVSFLVDGFNLYHSLKDAEKYNGSNCRWLDIHSLCSSFLSAIGGAAAVRQVFYFSALAYHCDQWSEGVTDRHKTYVKALESTGVIPIMGRFKKKDVHYKCEACCHRGTRLSHEEKETDVAMAVEMMKLAVAREPDVVALVSGDTDLVPAIRGFHSLCEKPVYVLCPWKRHNNDFASLVKGVFKITPAHYEKYQFPDSIAIPGGDVIVKPDCWKT